MTTGNIWRRVLVEDIARIERDAVLPEDIATGTKYVGLEHIDSDGNFVGVSPVTAGELASNKFRFGPNHILFGKLRPYLKKTARPEFVGICSTDILPLLPGPRVHRGFLFHFLRHPETVKEAVLRCTGANLPRLSPRDLEKLELPLPPLAEQRRIADILDEADAVRRKRKEAIALTEELLRSAFLEMFGDPVTNPKGWGLRPLGELCKLVRGSSPRPKGDARYYGGSVPRLMVADMTRDGLYVTPAIDSLTEEGARLSRPVHAGTVVMAVSGNVGVAARLRVDACIHDGFVGFVGLREELLLPDVLLFSLRLLRPTWVVEQAGAIFQNLTTADVKRRVMWVPSLETQRLFVSLMAPSRLLNAHVSTASAHADALFHSVVQRAFGTLPCE